MTKDKRYPLLGVPIKLTWEEAPVYFAGARFGAIVGALTACLFLWILHDLIGVR